jgi:hypothetical protein
MAGGDMYELTLEQLDRGQHCDNVFQFYQALEFVTTTPTKAQVLAENWVDQILPGILALQPAEVLTTGVNVKNLFDDSDGYHLPLTEVGSFGSDRELLPTFNAYAFRLNGDNPAVKSGAKRFAGVFEDYQNDGVVAGSPIITPLTALETLLVSPVTVGLVIPDNVFLPSLVKRVRSGVSPDYEYRMPENTGELIFSKLVVAIFNAVISSQVSRKIGVGI